MTENELLIYASNRARPQVVVQRDEFGINKQIQLDDGRQLNIQRDYGQDNAQVYGSLLPQTAQPGQKQDSVNTSGANHSSADYEIIARSLMRRMDTLENQLQVSQSVENTILNNINIVGPATNISKYSDELHKRHRMVPGQPEAPEYSSIDSTDLWTST